MWLYVPSVCSPGSEASTSALRSPARLAAFATWNGKRTAPRFWSRAWATHSWLRRLSGLTLPHSTAVAGVESWISSLRALPASPTASPDPGEDLPTEKRGGFVLGHVARIIGELGAPLVFMENVADWIAGGFFRDFGERLFRLGYRIPPPLLVTARQVGAPHLRERAFVLVYRDGHGLRELRRRGLHSERPAGGFTDDGGAELGDAARGGCGVVGHAALAGRGGHVDGDGVDVGDAHGERSHGRANRIEVGRQAAAPSADRRGTVPGTSRARLPLAESRELSGPQRHDEGGAAPELCRALFPPGPDATDEWRRIVIEYPDLAPAVEPGFCVLVDGVAYVVDASRAPQLRATGNGVVPLAAGIAFDFLLSEIGL